jgi:hypothetical protein
MALPKPLYDFFVNIKIPCIGVFGLGAGASVACAVGILPPSLMPQASALALVSGLAHIAVSIPVLVEDERRLHESNLLVQGVRALLVQEVRAAGTSPRFGNATEEVQRQNSRPTARLTAVASEVPENRLHYSFAAVCKGCVHYCGHNYLSYWGDSDVESVQTQFVCAMHPHGSDGESCPDWEVVPHEYRLIRLQGSGISCLYFVEVESSKSIESILQKGIEIDIQDEADTIDALCRKFERKSVNGLPGCIFKSRQSDIELAFQELLDSCPE